MAVVCLTVICCVALMKGIDSAIVGAICSAIGAIAGYSARKLRERAAGKK
ncbi:MAG: hypothetical protein QXS32_08480 [Candidatus Nezhaarchaeales archaeon]